MESSSQQKWAGKASAQLANATADQVWPVFVDFFNFHKWFPGLPTCYGIHGTNGEPGCIRYCAAFSLSSGGESGNSSANWSKERLTAINHVDRSLSYEIVDSNVGFNSYLATFKVFPESFDGKDGCLIEWSFTIEPIEGCVLEDLVAICEVGVNLLAKNIEHQLANSADN